MTTQSETVSSKTLKLKIEQDEDPFNPRTEYDNLAHFICFHRRYDLGDKHNYNHGDYSGWSEMERQLRKDGYAVILPLFMYDHSGITISTKPFGDPWDSGQIGFAALKRKDILKEYGCKVVSKKIRDKCISLIEWEVKTYDQYLTGDVWCFVIEDEDGEVIDSCCGFYGEEYCRREGEEAMSNLYKQYLISEMEKAP